MIPDIFAGAGGWSEGLRRIGLSTVGLEIDAAACSTRAAAGHLTIRCDVAAYPPDPFVGRARGLVGSPPCQAWSTAGKGAGRAEIDRVRAAVEMCRDGWTDAARKGPWADPRTPLILEPLRWAWALRGSLQWIALEQVPPALPVWRYMADVLRSWGFAADARRLCAADFGVPQTRTRAFLIAGRVAAPWPVQTHAKEPAPSLFGPALLPWVSMADALGWSGPGSVNTGRDWKPGGTRADAQTIEGSAPAPSVCGSSKAWRFVGGNQPRATRRDLTEPAPTRAFGHALNAVGWVHDRPATTIVGSHGAGTVAPPGHREWVKGKPRQNARGVVQISTTEAGVLQSFPPDYPWQGSRTAQFTQIGNAVPPTMAAVIVDALDRAHAEREAAA